MENSLQNDSAHFILLFFLATLRLASALRFGSVQSDLGSISCDIGKPFRYVTRSNLTESNLTGEEGSH